MKEEDKLIAIVLIILILAISVGITVGTIIGGIHEVEFAKAGLQQCKTDTNIVIWTKECK